MECERLRAEATRLELEHQDARTREEALWDVCREADTRVANLEGKLAELNMREDAPQLYLRIAETQIQLREAQAMMTPACEAAEAATTGAEAAQAVAEEAKAAADAACQAADDCEAAAG